MLQKKKKETLGDYVSLLEAAVAVYAGLVAATITCCAKFCYKNITDPSCRHLCFSK